MLNRLLAHAAETIAGIATQSAVDAIKRLAFQIVVIVIGLMVALTGLGFLCAAAYMALEHRYGGPQAATGVAIGLLALCAVCFITAALVGRKRSRAPAPEPLPVAEVPAHPLAADPAFAAVIDAMARPGRGTAKGDLAFLAAALGAGFAVGVSPQLRRSLMLGLSAVMAARTRDE